MANEDNERQVRCDAEGCGRWLFLSGSCSVTDDQYDAILALLGWRLGRELPDGSQEAYCPHCKPPIKSKPEKRRKS